jgi:lambda family phage portal protein
MSKSTDITVAATQPLAEKAMVGGAYEGASRISREAALWAPPIRSADGDIRGEKTLLDARGRDMARNEPYIAGAVDINKDSIVGGSYMLNAKPNWKVLKDTSKGFDEKWAEEFQEIAEAKFTLYAESPDNWLDAGRTMTFTGMIRLGIGVFTVGGEVLATAEWLRDVGRPYSTAIQMVDLDRLSNPNGVQDDLRLRQGVQRNQFGAPQGYHIRMAHPGDRFVTFEQSRWKYVPIRKPWGRLQVIHIIDPDRPDQTRGVAKMVSALKEMRMAKKYHEITLQNAVVNATYAAAIESELPPEQAFAALGMDGANEWIESYLDQISEYTGSSRNLHIDGVKIPHLFPGTKLKLLNAGQPGGVGTVFEESLLRKIAAGLGVSYEQLARDYSKTNYSSARAAMLETHKGMQAKKKMVADRYASSIYSLWLEEALQMGELPLPAGVKRDTFFYQGQNKDAICNAGWIGANRGQIDELKETQAAVMRIKAGLSTYEVETARMGSDFREVFAQRAREDALIESYGLDFNADPSQGSAQGGEVKDAKKPGKDKGRLGPGKANENQDTGSSEDDSDSEDSAVFPFMLIGEE